MSSCPCLSVIVASGGRPSLSGTLGSIVPQLTVYDQLLVMVDQRSPYGHASKNLMMRWATGTHLAFADDDEVWVPGSVELIRSRISGFPDDAHLFAGGPIVIPARLSLSRWEGGQDRLARFVEQVGRRGRVLSHPERVIDAAP